MTIIIEISRPFLRKPGYFKSRLMKRIWWGWFAIAITKRGLHELGDRTKTEWINKGGKY